MKRLLLVSRQKPPEYKNILDHCEGAVLDFLGKQVQRVLFIPFALKNVDFEIERVGRRMTAMGYKIEALDLADDPIASIKDSEAIYMGGGNTFRLLYILQKNGLLESIRQKVLNGIPYIGISAGSVMACPTIQTTNNMAAMWPDKSEALNLVPFQINPHYADTEPDWILPGETREDKINEFLEENDRPVVGLYGENWLRIEGDQIELQGSGPGMRFFQSEVPSRVYSPGQDISFLLDRSDISDKSD